MAHYLCCGMLRGAVAAAMWTPFRWNSPVGLRVQPDTTSAKCAEGARRIGIATEYRRARVVWRSSGGVPHRLAIGLERSRNAAREAAAEVGALACRCECVGRGGALGMSERSKDWREREREGARDGREPS